MNHTRVPTPGVLSMPTSPPISSASRRVTARPSPDPPYARVIDASPCSKAPNNLGMTSGAIPIPVSATSKRTRRRPAAASRSSPVTRTEPRSVNFTALLARFSSAWRNRAASPCSHTGTAWPSISRDRPLAWAAPETMDPT